MFQKLLICNILFIPLIHSINITTVDQKHDRKVEKVSKETVRNDLNVSIISEGGASLSETQTLPKDTLIDLMSLEEGITKRKEKPIHPRKGVENYVISNITEPPSLITNITVTNTTKYSNSTEKPTTAIIKNVTKIIKIPTTAAPVVHKPSLLSSDQMDHDKIIHEKLSATKTEIPSSNIHSKTTTKNPGMVIPIVITILVVPMFAVLGYMALKRGQEAWKNRHYKRMDFLLDGMYND